MKRTTQQILRAARAAGSHYFDRDTMEEWGTITTEHTYDAGKAGTVLLISDQPFEQSLRRYRPVLSRPNGRVHSLLRIDAGPTNPSQARILASMAAHWLREGMSVDGVADRLAVDYPWVMPTPSERN